MTPFGPRNPSNREGDSLSSHIFERLVTEISTGAWRPGSFLREVEIAKRFDVSRTPVREVLLRLREHGLAVDKGNGVEIRRLTVRDVAELYAVRRSLELTAVKLAWGRLTEADFTRLREAEPGDRPDEPGYADACARYDLLLHRTIAIRSENRLLAKTLRRLHVQVLLVCRPVGDRVTEHRAIVEAFRTGDRRTAVRAMARHLKAAYQTQRAIARAMAEDPASGSDPELAILSPPRTLP